MIKIGAFAKLSQVSIKTLRYYDSLGLLRPAVVDEHSGYRYYSEEQLLTMKRIAAFREHGFTLEQIMPLLEEEMPPEAVKSRLTEKQEELQRTIREAQQRLREIEGRLHRVDKSTEFHDALHSITIRSVDPQLAASIREVVPRSQLCLLLDEVTQYVRSNGEDPAGSLIIVWHEPDTESDQVDMEVALPIKQEIPGSSKVKVGMLPGWETAASYVHHCDPYSSSCGAAAPLSSWIASNGYAPIANAPIREIYLTPDKDMYGKMRLAELLIPVELEK